MSVTMPLQLPPELAGIVAMAAARQQQDAGLEAEHRKTEELLQKRVEELRATNSTLAQRVQVLEAQVTAAARNHEEALRAKDKTIAEKENQIRALKAQNGASQAAIEVKRAIGVNVDGLVQQTQGLISFVQSVLSNMIDPWNKQYRRDVLEQYIGTTTKNNFTAIQSNLQATKSALTAVSQSVKK